MYSPDIIPRLIIPIIMYNIERNVFFWPSKFDVENIMSFLMS